MSISKSQNLKFSKGELIDRMRGFNETSIRRKRLIENSRYRSQVSIDCSTEAFEVFIDTNAAIVEQINLANFIKSEQNKREFILEGIERLETKIEKSKKRLSVSFDQLSLMKDRIARKNLEIGSIQYVNQKKSVCSQSN
jgi:hypothetical protein